MQISVSSTLTVYHDGQFWVGLAEHFEALAGKLRQLVQKQHAPPDRKSVV